MPRNELARIEGPRDDEPQRVEVLPAPRQELSMEELWMVAEQACKSGLYADSARNPSAAFMLALRCQAEGIHPGLAFAQFHVIEGRPALRADAMQARYQQAGGRVRWIRTNNEVCEAEFWHPTLMPDPVRIKKTIAEYRASGLTRGRDGEKKNWKQFPDAMLRARVLAAGVRAVLPAVVCGVYTPEEVSDMGSGSLAGPSSSPPGPAPTPAIGPPMVDEPEAPPPPSFKAFCEQVAHRGVLDAMAACRAILIAADDDVMPPPDAPAKAIGRAAKAIWDRDPEQAARWVAEAEARADNDDQSLDDDEDDLPELGGDDQAEDDAPPAADSPAAGPADPRAEYLLWVQRTAEAEGLEPIDVLRIVHDAGVSRKLVAAVGDRNDADLLATRGKAVWSKDPELASRAVDHAVGGDAPEPAPEADGRSKADRVADEL